VILMPAPVVIADYDPDRPARFARLYVCPVGSPALARHLALRDLLRADPEAAAAYADLKRALAARFRHDRVAYTEAKTAFIDSLLAAR
jgi:GrpB-like predicted nucleotidyltransferase (UPF0157 family)